MKIYSSSKHLIILSWDGIGNNIFMVKKLTAFTEKVLSSSESSNKISKKGINFIISGIILIDLNNVV